MPSASGGGHPPEFQLLEVITNPDKHRQRLEELMTAQQQADKQIAAAQELEASNIAATDKLHAAMEDLAQRQQALAKRMADVDAREKNLQRKVDALDPVLAQLRNILGIK